MFLHCEFFDVGFCISFTLVNLRVSGVFDSYFLN